MDRIKTLHFDVDGLRLTGDLHLPEAEHPPVVIGCHGLLADRQSPKQKHLAEICTANGIAYFRFDHRGCGESQGAFARVTTLAARCRDLYHAIDLMQSHPATGPLLALFGSSFGGSVVLAVAARHQVPAVVTFAAPIHSLPVQPATLQGLSPHAQAEPRLVDNLRFDLRSDLAAVSNILIIHGDRDEVVPVAHARELYARVQDPKHLAIQPGGDHPMSLPAHQQQFASDFLGWVTRPVADAIIAK